MAAILCLPSRFATSADPAPRGVMPTGRSVNMPATSEETRMSNPVRTLLALAIALCLLPLQTARAADDGGAKKKILLLAGGPSHGFGAHDHLSGCHLLAKRLNDSNLGVEATVIQGWPKEKADLDGA